MYITTFRVSGRGLFPVDMLRYDQCYPASSEDVLGMTGDYQQPRDVTLARCHATYEPGVTDGRWNSFGWGVRILSTRKV